MSPAERSVYIAIATLVFVVVFGLTFPQLVPLALMAVLVLIIVRLGSGYTPPPPDEEAEEMPHVPQSPPPPAARRHRYHTGAEHR